MISYNGRLVYMDKTAIFSGLYDVCLFSSVGWSIVFENVIAAVRISRTERLAAFQMCSSESTELKMVGQLFRRRKKRSMQGGVLLRLCRRLMYMYIHNYNQTARLRVFYNHPKLYIFCSPSNPNPSVLAPSISDGETRPHHISIIVMIITQIPLNCIYICVYIYISNEFTLMQCQPVPSDRG